MHALVYLDCSFTHCYTLVDEAEKRRQFSLMNGLTWRVILLAFLFENRLGIAGVSLEALNQF